MISIFLIVILFTITTRISCLNAVSITKRWGLGSMIGNLINKVNTRWAECYNPINVRIVKSGVLNFAPWLELHHVVFLSPNTKSKGVFAIDFTPINQEDIKTVIKLIQGQNVPAVIRVKYIHGSSIKDQEDKIKNEWSCMKFFLPYKDKDPTDTFPVDISKPNIYDDPDIVSDFSDKEELALMQKTIDRIYHKWNKRWNTHMNFYTHNCIHFSYFVRQMLKEDEVCNV